MKLLRVAVHDELGEEVEKILDRNGVRDFIRHPRMPGGDPDGRHDGSRVHPGTLTVLEAPVGDDAVEALFSELERLRDGTPAARHLRALVLPIDRALPD